MSRMTYAWLADDAQHWHAYSGTMQDVSEKRVYSEVQMSLDKVLIFDQLSIGGLQFSFDVTSQ